MSSMLAGMCVGAVKRCKKKKGVSTVSLLGLGIHIIYFCVAIRMSETEKHTLKQELISYQLAYGPVVPTIVDRCSCSPTATSPKAQPWMPEPPSDHSSNSFAGASTAGAQKLTSTVPSTRTISGSNAALHSSASKVFAQSSAQLSTVLARAAAVTQPLFGQRGPTAQPMGPQPAASHSQQQPQPQQQQAGTTLSALAVHGLALANSHPDLWEQMSGEQQFVQAWQQGQQRIMQGANSISAARGITPAHTPEMMAFIQKGLNSLMSETLTKFVRPQQPLPAAVAAAVPVNTTCSWDERPYVYVPVPAPVPVAQYCNALSLADLLRCTPEPAAAAKTRQPDSEDLLVLPMATLVYETASKVSTSVNGWQLTAVVRTNTRAVLTTVARRTRPLHGVPQTVAGMLSSLVRLV